MRFSSGIAIALALTMTWPAQAQDTSKSDFSFASTGEFLSQCGGASPPEECLNAIMRVEEVVNRGPSANSTCDGGPDALLKAGSDAELNMMLGQRLVRVVAWLQKHPEVAGKYYGDGVWTALQGVYCQ